MSTTMWFVIGAVVIGVTLGLAGIVFLRNKRSVVIKATGAPVPPTTPVGSKKAMIASFFKAIITRESMGVMRLAVSIFVLAVISGACLAVLIVLGIGKWIPIWANILISCAIWLALVGWFIYSALRDIPANPPHKAIVVFFGERQKCILNEGLCFLPLYPYVFDVVLVSVTSVNQDLPKQQIKTPDNADLLVMKSLTWTPGRKNCSPTEEAESFIVFKNKGGEMGVRSILEDVLEDRLRVWAYSKEEGPADWKELMGAKDTGTVILVKAVLGDVLPSIPSTIPTEVLIRYFAKPQLPPLTNQKKRYGNKKTTKKMWEGLEEELSTPPNDITVIEEAIKSRMKIVDDMRRGNGSFYMPSLGITINRLNITEVMLTPELEKAVRTRTKEQEQKKGEKVELDFVGDSTNRLVKKTHVTPDRAMDQVTIERDKAKAFVNVHRIDSGSGSPPAGIFLGTAGPQEQTVVAKKSKSESEEEKED